LQIKMADSLGGASAGPWGRRLLLVHPGGHQHPARRVVRTLRKAWNAFSGCWRCGAGCRSVPSAVTVWAAASRLSQSAPRRRFPQPASRVARSGRGTNLFLYPRAWAGCRLGRRCLVPAGKTSCPARPAGGAVAFLAALGDW